MQGITGISYYINLFSLHSNSNWVLREHKAYAGRQDNFYNPVILQYPIPKYSQYAQIHMLPKVKATLLKSLKLPSSRELYLSGPPLFNIL